MRVYIVVLFIALLSLLDMQDLYLKKKIVGVLRTLVLRWIIYYMEKTVISNYKW